MWSSHSIRHDDDAALKRLKRQLANLTCNCKICEKYNLTIHEDIVSERCKSENTKPNENPCPGCFVAYNLLKRTDKTFKDEETNADIVRFSSDKSMQKTTSGLNRTTSMTKSVTVSLNTDELNILNETDVFEEYQHAENRAGHIKHCLCLENFIDSIRPPLKYAQF